MTDAEKRERKKIESIISKPRKELLDFIGNFVKNQKQRRESFKIRVSSLKTSMVPL